MYLSTATWPSTAKEDFSGSKKAVFVREGLGEEEKEKNGTHHPKTFFLKMVTVGYRIGFCFSGRLIRGKGGHPTLPVMSQR